MKNIYLALDFPTWKKASEFLKRYKFQGVPVKVGMELFYREGPDLIKALKDDGHSIFLDLKLHDIPMTVYRSMKNIAKLGVDLVNVHAQGGSEMMIRAKEGLMEGNDSQQTKLLAVTLLTSFHEQKLKEELLIKKDIEKYVTHLAKIANKSGCDGVVCSVHEVKAIKKMCGSSFLTITPGIRLKQDEQHDQTRIATPIEARHLGTDKLVIGRT